MLETLGHLLVRIDERGRADLPLLGVSVASGVRARIDGDGRPAPSLDLSGYKIVRPDDVIMNALGKPHGSIGRSEVLGITSPAYWVLRTTGGLDPAFAHHLLRSQWAVSRYTGLGKNLPPNQFDIPWEVFAKIEIWLPSSDEQRRIADFLDDRVTRIDQIIAARQNQVAMAAGLLTRFSYEAIHGDEFLDRRDSGLEWLPDVPADWPVLSVQSQFHVDLGKMLDEKKQSGSNQVPYLRNTNVQWDRIDLTDLKAMDIAPDERERFTLQPGDLLICEGGQPGRAAIWRGGVEPLGYQKALHRARSRGRSLPEWLVECLRIAAALNVFSVSTGQTTIAHLPNDQLRSLKFPFPEPDVQQRVVNSLDAQRGHIISLASACEEQIDLLNEYKQSLITAAVTGELDVTAASIEIPE